MIVRNGMLLVAVGIGIGSIGAYAAGGAIRTQLFNTPPPDPSMFGIVAAVLSCITLIATLLPTRRAVRVNPQMALRGD